MASFGSFHNYPKGKKEGNRWGEALAILETKGGTPYYFNFHVREVGNSLFVGPMGSGKTLLLAAFLTFSTKYQGWRFVFDKDRGMELIVRALGGHYHIVKAGVPSGLAPLQLDDSPENRAFNVLLLQKILSDSSALSESELQDVHHVIQAAFNLPKHLRIYRNIAPLFGVSQKGNLRERFDKWHSQGQYAWVFDNDTDSLDMSHKISGQDIGDLLKEGLEEVSTAVLMYMFHRIGSSLDSSPTAVFIPEGWKALSHPLFKEQLTDWSKTPRKNNMALIIDTQKPSDLAKSVAGRSVVAESVTQVFFANEKAEEEDYKVFNLSPKEFHLIKHELPSQAHEHFFLLKQGDVSTVVRLNLNSLNDDIGILSTNKASAMLLDDIREHVGDDKNHWMSHFLILNKRMQKECNNDFPKFTPALKTYWEDKPCV